MINQHNYTDKQINQILSEMIILIDTREQENEHITDYFDKKKIAYRSQKLNTGDYSFCIPANSQLNIPREIHFDKDIAIERKATLEELSNNLTHDRQTFENELIRSLRLTRFNLMIENESGYKDIIENNYRSGYNNKAFHSSLISLSLKYNVHLFFCDKNYSAIYIYSTLIYYLKNYLENKLYFLKK